MTALQKQRRSEIPNANGDTQSAMNELSRAHQALERYRLNIPEVEKQTALRAAKDHTARAVNIINQLARASAPATR